MKGTIWNMVTGADGSLLVLEVRDEENFVVRFATLDTASNLFLFRDAEVEEKWWASLISADDSIAIVQTFEGSGNPERKDLLAIDIRTGNLRWTTRQFALYSWAENGSLLGYVLPSMEKATVNSHSGMISVGDWKSLVSKPAVNTQSPVSYMAGSDHFQSVKTFLQNKRDEHIEGGVEYLELDGRILLSYYVADRQDLANYLLVSDSDGNELLHEKLGENLSGLGVHTFFTLRDCVIFVKNKSELVSYSLYD